MLNTRAKAWQAAARERESRRIRDGRHGGDERIKQWLRPVRRTVVAAGQQLTGALSAGYHRRLPPRLVMTLLARDEADIVAATIEHAFSIGVDFIIATDHRSTDGTTEILRDYRQTGRLELFEVRTPRFEQARWVTRMARRAALVHRASWVINHDADEFVWPASPDGSLDLSATLSRVAAETGLCGMAELRFAVDPSRSGGWADRVVACGPGNRWSGYPFWKVCHRADPAVRVLHGNHFAYGPRIGGLAREPLLTVLHFPERSLAQYTHKLEVSSSVLADRGVGLRGEVELMRRGDFAAVFAQRNRHIADQLAAGRATIDTRLRDRLHGLLPGAVLPHRLAEALSR